MSSFCSRRATTSLACAALLLVWNPDSTQAQIRGPEPWQGGLAGLSGDSTFTKSSGGDPVAATQAALKGFEQQVVKAMKELRVPGVAIGIVRDGKIVYTHGFGDADDRAGKRVTPKTLFPIGSATKAFTTFAMAKLVEEGKLDWDKPAIRYLPGLRLYDDYATSHLTPRDMVTHRSGLPRHDLVWYNNYDFGGSDVLMRLADFKPNKELRQAFQYNNVMYLAAGHLVSRVSGKSWQEAIRDMVLVPLGMNATNFSVLDAQKAEDFALPYGEANGKLRLLNFRDMANIAPAGAINSNVEDMSKWLTLQLSDGMFEGKRLIKRATLEEMHTPQIVVGGVPNDPMISPATYGLGWFIDTYRGHYRVQHGGNVDGFSTLVTLFPHDRIGIVVLTNKNGSQLPELTVRLVADRLLRLGARDWYSEASRRRQLQERLASERRANDERVSGTRPAHPLKAYAGDYTHPAYGTLTIEFISGKAGGRLVMIYNEIETLLEHWHYDVFSGLENPSDPTFHGFKIVFQTDRAGRVSGVEAAMEPNVPPILFTRKPDKVLSDAEYIEKFAGTYEVAQQVITVNRSGDQLTLVLPDHQSYDLLPGVGNEYEVAGITGLRVQFLLRDDGQVAELVLKQPAQVIAAKRIVPPQLTIAQ